MCISIAVIKYTINLKKSSFACGSTGTESRMEGVAWRGLVAAVGSWPITPSSIHRKERGGASEWRHLGGRWDEAIKSQRPLVMIYFL